MNHIRAHLRMMTNEEVSEFVSTLNQDGTTDKTTRMTPWQPPVRLRSWALKSIP